MWPLRSPQNGIANKGVPTVFSYILLAPKGQVIFALNINLRFPPLARIIILPVINYKKITIVGDNMTLII
jgi:hypothetical protein